MRLSARFRGAGVALITPFNPDFSIDFPSLGNIIDNVIEGGIDFIVALGTTGEANTLSPMEHREVLNFIIQKVNQRCPIVAGIFGDNSTARLANKIINFNFEGIDAIMVSSPAYNKPTQSGIYEHYLTIAEVAPRPIIIYNVPGRTSSNIEAYTIIKLAAANEKFIAIKEASGDIIQSMHILKRRPSDFLLLSGEDQLTLPILGCGGNGVISVIANVYPNTFSQMVTNALQGDLNMARQINEQLLDLHHWLYLEGNPAGIKSALQIKGWCHNQVRLPLKPLSEVSYQALKKEMALIEI